MLVFFFFVDNESQTSCDALQIGGTVCECGRSHISISVELTLDSTLSFFVFVHMQWTSQFMRFAMLKNQAQNPHGGFDASAQFASQVDFALAPWQVSQLVSASFLILFHDVSEPISEGVSEPCFVMFRRRFRILFQKLFRRRLWIYFTKFLNLIFRCFRRRFGTFRNLSEAFQIEFRSNFKCFRNISDGISELSGIFRNFSDIFPCPKHCLNMFGNLFRTVFQTKFREPGFDAQSGNDIRWKNWE